MVRKQVINLPLFFIYSSCSDVSSELDSKITPRFEQEHVEHVNAGTD